MGPCQSSSLVNFKEVPHFLNSREHRIFCKYWNPTRYNTMLKRNGVKSPKKSRSPTPVAMIDLRAAVFVSHGVGEHCLYYESMAEVLMKENILVFSHDHVGHGLSEGERVNIANFNEYVLDVMQHVEKVRKYHPSIPMFILGHGVGGTIALLAALERPDLFRGIILLSPYIVPGDSIKQPPALLVALGRIVNWLAPWGIVSSPPNLECLSRNKILIRKYNKDPFNWHSGLKLSWLLENISATKSIQQRITQVELPLVVFHGDADQVASIEGSKLLYSLSSSLDKTLKVVKGAYHFLHHEPDGVQDVVVMAILEWIIART